MCDRCDRSGLSQKVLPVQAHPYFKLDCNAGGSLHAPSSAAQPSPIQNSSQGGAPQGLVALELVAPTSGGTAASLDSIQAVSVGQGKAGHVLQACSEPADRFSNGSSTCLIGAAASAEAAQLRSHGSEGNSAFIMKLLHVRPASAASYKVQAGLVHNLYTDMLCCVDLGG